MVKTLHNHTFIRCRYCRGLINERDYAKHIKQKHPKEFRKDKASAKAMDRAVSGGGASALGSLFEDRKERSQDYGGAGAFRRLFKQKTKKPQDYGGDEGFRNLMTRFERKTKKPQDYGGDEAFRAVMDKIPDRPGAKPESLKTRLGRDIGSFFRRRKHKAIDAYEREKQKSGQTGFMEKMRREASGAEPKSRGAQAWLGRRKSVRGLQKVGFATRASTGSLGLKKLKAKAPMIGLAWLLGALSFLIMNWPWLGTALFFLGLYFALPTETEALESAYKRLQEELDEENKKTRKKKGPHAIYIQPAPQMPQAGGSY